MSGLQIAPRQTDLLMMMALAISLTAHGLLLAHLPLPVGTPGEAPHPPLPPLPRLEIRLAERPHLEKSGPLHHAGKPLRQPRLKPVPTQVGLQPLPRLAQLNATETQSGTQATPHPPLPPEFYRRSQLDTPPRPRHNLDLLEHWMDEHQDTLVLVFKLWVDDAGHIVRAEAEPPAAGETVATAIRERYIHAIVRRLLALQFEPGTRQQQAVNGITYIEVTVDQRQD